MAAMEQAALSGVLFEPRSRSVSPTRSASTSSPTNTDDELGSDLELDSPRAGGRRGGRHHSATLSPEEVANSSANLLASRKSAQTGPKGVIEDRRIHTAVTKANREETIRRVREDQERRAIIAPTIEEEALAREKEAALERSEDVEAHAKWRAKRREELQRAKARKDDQEAEEGGAGVRKRGGLKEVGQEGFLLAVERTGWVVILIYEPDIPRCQTLLASLLHLSLNLPPASSLPCPISLFRARASSLSFSLLPPKSSGRALAEVEDEEEDEEEEYEEPYEDEPTGKPDPDVLPSILAYKDGQLSKTWIRADWEVNEDGVEGLLRREGILPPLNGLARLNAGIKDLLSGSDDDE